jgi:UDPglucose 6-dehydrogenase
MSTRIQTATVIGFGVVGSALARALERNGVTVRRYDPPAGLFDAGWSDSEAFFICVPTPFAPDEGVDEFALRSAFEDIPSGRTVVIRSTVLPGTTDRYQEQRGDLCVLHVPEFLTESRAEYDELHPARQIVGYTQASEREANRVLEVLPRAPFERIVPARIAEAAKYFSNTFFALKVAFANQMFDLFESIGVDYDAVQECAEADPMIAAMHLEIFHAGYRGYGGKCLPKDTRALLHMARNIPDQNLSILRAADAYNSAIRQPKRPR